jgi:PAS domain S-box-containing protein
MNNNLKVLFIDDSRLSVEAAAVELKKQGFHIEYDQVSQLSDVLDELTKYNYDLIVSEFNLSKTTVTEILGVLSSLGIHIPLVVFSDNDDEKDILSCIEAGCRDYLLKSNNTHLKSIVIRILSGTERNFELEKKQKQLITERQYLYNKLKEAEKELSEEQRKFLDIFDAAPMGLVVLDGDLIIRHVNIAITNSIGKSAESMVNSSFESGICGVSSSQDGRACRYGKTCDFCALKKIISDVKETDIAVCGKDLQSSDFIGEFKKDMWFRVSVVPILINRKKHIILIMEDITLDKINEESIINSRDFYLTLFESFPALIWRSGLDAKCNYFNKGWMEFTGRTLEDELGNGWATGVHPDDAEGCYNTYIEAFNARRSFEMEYRLRRSDGEYRWLNDVASPFYDPDGNFLGYIGSCYDITEKKNEIKILKELKKTQNQLVQQEKLAAIGQLAAGVAHEINNPLGYIMSNLNTLEKYSIRLKEVLDEYGGLKEAVDESDNEESKNVFKKAFELRNKYDIDYITEDLKALLDDTNDGLNRIKKIVMGLRTFSREDEQDERTDYDLNVGIENTILIANNEIKYHADIIMKLDNIPLVTLSGNQVNQVLLNLIINAAHAIKARGDGQRGLIEVCTYKENKYICCDIKDNGIGIPEENLNKIFNPFFTTKPVGQGTGLGLSISYDIIVHQLYGEMLVKSTPGKDTVFTIKLPAQVNKR